MRKFICIISFFESLDGSNNLYEIFSKDRTYYCDLSQDKIRDNYNVEREINHSIFKEYDEV